MEPNNTLDMIRQGDLGGSKINMTFDANSIAHIMSVLTDLYSDPELAVIREYSTNALDSHIAAGNKRPIEVQTPSAMSPYFKVKDYGLGLSVDDITEIYSKYGASTKRDTNEQTGMLGLGCKSALTYTSQFTIVAVKNGVKTQVMVGRIEDGTGVMEVVDTVATNEPNGVEIIVPVKSASNFSSKAKNFFKFWQPGLVLLDGAEPVYVGGKAITPNTFMVDKLDRDYIVMGNVAYPTAESLYGGDYNYREYGVVAYVEMGAVNFTPSREALHSTTLTKNTIQTIKADFEAALIKSAQDDIDSAPNNAEAVRRYFFWWNNIGSSLLRGVTYRGQTIPFQFNGKFITYQPTSYRYQTHGASAVAFHDLEKGNLIENFDCETLSQTQKLKIKQWLAQTGKSGHVILANGPIDPVWLGAFDKAQWSDIKAIKLPSSGTGQGRKSLGESYEVFDRSLNRLIAKDKFSSTDETIYLSPADKCVSAKSLTALFPDATIVMMGANRWDKFVRNVPQAQHWTVAAQKILDAAFAALTENDYMSISVDYYTRHRTFGLVPSDVDDPQIKEYLEIISQDSNDRIDTYTTLVQKVGRFISCPAVPKRTISNPLVKYPLLSGSQYSTPNKEHVIIYLNAVYAANQASEKGSN